MIQRGASSIIVINGLLLLTNIDKAFDLGYISFGDRGRKLIYEHLDELQALGINSEMRVLFTKQHHDYLAYRGKQFRQGCKNKMRL